MGAKLRRGRRVEGRAAHGVAWLCMALVYGWAPSRARSGGRLDARSGGPGDSFSAKLGCTGYGDVVGTVARKAAASVAATVSASRMAVNCERATVASAL
jgi:hypothetical protein